MHVNANGRGHQDYKMFVVGHRAVGKSALVVRFLTNRFISEYQENSEMTCDGMVEVDGEKMQLRIQDTSEKGIRLPTIDLYFREADAIMLVYSITDRTSFERLRSTTTRLKEKLTEHEFSDDKLEKIPILAIIANKGDLEHCREVKTHEGMELAERLGCHFYETSASEGWSKQFVRNRAGSMGSKSVNGVTLSRPDSLWCADKSGTRRKSDPALIFNSIFDPKKITSPDNDVNNNQKKTMTSPLAIVPQISISPSDNTQAERIPSRGRRFLEKLSPRLPKKFGGGSKPQNAPRMMNISAGLARMSAPGLAVGAMGRGSSNTLPVKPVSIVTTRDRSVSSPVNAVKEIQKSNFRQRTHTLRADGSWTSSFSDASSSSSSESLAPPSENEIRHALFFRAETPVSDPNLSSSDEEDLIAIAKTAHAARNIRRSRSSSRLSGGNFDSDSTRQGLSAIHHRPRGRSETRISLSRRETELKTPRVKAIIDSDYKENKFNVSEPFKHLCRDARNARRMRERLTPTKFFRDGIRKIKTSLVSEPTNNNFHFKNPHFQVTAVGR